ncbi:MAG: (2Fe-2S)-binding protein [Gammaproteobacteria bacterium]|nr:(2Fe-2S)-binding protein [Gammaproteobacteria bacterium]
MSARRLPPVAGEWIDRSRELTFSFEGATYRAFEGDVITSALIAAGRTMLGRSFKYHRPRGVFSLANHDANVIVETASRINIRADVEAPVAGEIYSAVNTTGGLERDFGRHLGWLAPFLPVGFYYKIGHKPRRLFPYFEKLIRHASGLGRVAVGQPRDRLPFMREYCDVLVVGAGAAGLAAAAALAGRGLRVIVADENARVGGSLGYAQADEPAAQAFLADSVAALDGVEVWTGATAVGLYGDLECPVVRPDRLSAVTARAIVIATGVLEQPAVFHNNDLPGVMTTGAAQRLVHRYAVAPCSRAVVLAGNPQAYRAAIDLKQHGVGIEAIVDLEDPESRGELAGLAQAAGLRVVGRSFVHAAQGRDGRLVEVEVLPLGASPGATPQRLPCDGLLVSVGYAPAAQLLHQLRARFAFDAAVGQMVPAGLPAGLYAAGRVNGVFELDARIADGRAAAAEVLGTLGIPTAGAPRPPRTNVRQSHPQPLFEHPKRKNFVDFDEDIQLHDLRTACREGFDNVELLKRFTTNGMGPSQGKHSHLNASRFLAGYHGQTLEQAGTPTARPFYQPVALGALAGRRRRLVLETPLVAEHEAAGVQWMEAGSWNRPARYRRGAPGDPVREEYLAVRERVGLIDVGTLGKIEVFGRDALELLNLAYTSDQTKLRVGMTRYMVMTDHKGTIADDGVLGRFGERHYYLTAGTGHALATYRSLKQLAAFAKLDVEVVDRTRHMAAINVAGPRTRELLQPLVDIDLGAAAFPFLAAREAKIGGVPARFMRVGFVGEVGFEIHLPPSAAGALWRELLTRGQAFGICPFGVEAQRLLRLEKGHLIVGQDTDGVTHPYETNLAWTVSLAKPRFVGRAALEYLKDRATRMTVGFTTEHRDPRLPLEESHLAIAGRDIVGRVTSVGFSPTLDRTVGIAMLDKTHAALDTPLTFRLTNGTLVGARVVALPFYDPDNARQKAEGGA